MPFLLFAAEPAVPDRLGDTLKIVQICFYGLGIILGFLTYRAARKGWLTPTNTEYQKRVMDRLPKLSEDLYAEFDPTSDHYWPKMRSVETAIEGMNEIFGKQSGRRSGCEEVALWDPGRGGCPKARPVTPTCSF